MGNTRWSSSHLSGTPWASNHSRHFFGENFPIARSMNSQPRVYFVARIFLSVIPVVTLHRHHPDMMTFFPGLVFFSKRCMWRVSRHSCVGRNLSVFSSIVAAVMSPAAPAPMITIFFMRMSISIFSRKLKKNFLFFCHLFSIYSSLVS